MLYHKYYYRIFGRIVPILQPFKVLNPQYILSAKNNQKPKILCFIDVILRDRLIPYLPSSSYHVITPLLSIFMPDVPILKFGCFMSFIHFLCAFVADLNLLMVGLFLSIFNLPSYPSKGMA